MESSRQTRNITSTNGDGELVQAKLEAVDGSRLRGFFVHGSFHWRIVRGKGFFCM